MTGCERAAEAERLTSLTVQCPSLMAPSSHLVSVGFFLTNRLLSIAARPDLSSKWLEKKVECREIDELNLDQSGVIINMCPSCDE